MTYLLCLENSRGSENWIPFRSLRAMLEFGKAQMPANKAKFFWYVDGEIKPIIE